MAGQVQENQQAPFGDPRDAIRWADNYLLRPDCKTITGKLMEDNIQQSRVVNMIDARCLAIAISTTLASVDTPHGRAVRLVYGRGDSHRMEIACRLAHSSWVGPENGKTIAAARDLALLTVAQVKERERHGRRLPTTLIADQMKMCRSSFYARWGTTYSAMKEEFDFWLDVGMRRFNDKLVEAGIVG